MSTAGRERGRYAIHGTIGEGGMATVHLGRRFGDGGFHRTVAVKRLSADLAEDADAVDMLADEARIASRIEHANVVPVHDVVFYGNELFLVMEHVMGASLVQLVRAVVKRDARIPAPVIRTIMAGVLRGLHAAHEARGDDGQPLGIIHRDVSPSNILVGVDGIPRLVDFGIAKAKDRVANTVMGQLKGKVGYMAPEQLRGVPADVKVDIYASGVVLWEMLAQQRLRKGDDHVSILAQVLHGNIPPPSTLNPEVTPEDDAIVRRAVQVDPLKRFATAAEMADAIEQGGAMATQSEVARFVADVASDLIEERRRLLDDMMRSEPVTWIGGPQESSRSGARPLLASPPPPPMAAPVGRPILHQPTAIVPPGDRGRPATRWAVLVATLGFSALAVALVVAFAFSRAPREAPSGPIEVVPIDDPPPVPIPTALPVHDAGEVAVVASASAAPPPRPRPRPASNCNPPYRVDSQGIKIFKPECLH